MRFPLVGPAYTPQSPSVDAETLFNWYVERVESDGGRSRAVLYPRPGLTTFATLPLGNVRGSIAARDKLFVIGGPNGYRVDNDATVTQLTGVENDSAPVSMATGQNEVIVVSGGKVYWFPIASAGSVIEIANLQNDAGTYDLDWSISQIGVSSISVPLTSISEVGNTVTVTFNAGAFSATQLLAIVAGNAMRIASVSTVTQYNGDYSVVSVNTSNISAVQVTFTHGTSGLASDSTGTIAFYIMEIIASVGVRVEVGDTIEVTNCSTGNFNRQYTVTSTFGSTAPGLIQMNCKVPVALLSGSTTSQTDGDVVIFGITPIQVVYLDGYYIILYRNSQYIRISGLFAPFQWDAADMARVSVFNDNIVGMIVDHRELWLLGQTKAVAYYNSGNEFPFDPILSSVIEQGCVAPFAPVRMDNSIFWIGRDERGAMVAYRANGYLPQRVSTHAVETAWQRYATASDAESFSFQWNGHSFWVIYFPTADETWVFDAALGPERGWSHWSYWDDEHVAFRGRCHVFAFGKHLIGDPESGKIYELELEGDDFGDPIQYERQAPPIASENKRIVHSRLELDLDSDEEEISVNVDWTENGGNSYSATQTLTGAPGSQFVLRRLGMGRNRSYRIRTQDPVRVIDGYVDAEVATR